MVTAYGATWVASSILMHMAAALVLGLATVAFYRVYLHPLAGIPGPRLAALSSCWYAYQARSGQLLSLGKTLHKKYGPVVRVAPNEVWFDSKEAFRIIYNPTGGYEKSDFYLATALLKPKLHWPSLTLESPDTLDLLAERDMKRYRQQRRLIGPVYHLANLKQYERALEEDVLPRVIARLRALPRSDSDEQQCQPPLVDLQEWMHMTVVEALGAVSLSWSPGYLACGSDGASGKHAYLGWRRKTVFGIFPAAVLLESLSKSAGRAFAVLWRVTYHTPKQGFKPFFPAVQKKISQRVKAALRENNTAQSAKGGKNKRNVKPQPAGPKSDLMADLLQLHKDRPEFTEHYLRRMAITNFGAGHETMTSTLVSALAMIGSHAEVQARVAREVCCQLASSFQSLPYDQAVVQLPFTQASVREAQRLHPVIGMALPRRVPAGGMEVNGYHLPPGTTVGCNPVSLHRNVDVFGDDADVYRPERWLEKEEDESRRREMERYNLIYGGGARTCPGRSLAEMLVAKIVPALFREFEVQIEMPPEEDMPYYFMAMLTGVKARFIPREEQSQTLS